MLPSQQPQPREAPAQNAPALPAPRRKKSQRASSSKTHQRPVFTPDRGRSSHSATGIAQGNDAEVEAVLARSWSEVSLGFEEARDRAWRGKALVAWIVESDWFNNGIIVLIVLNSVILACYDPSQSAESSRNAWIDMSDYLFQALFTLEAVLRVAHLGCKGYFRDPLNVCDFVLVVLGFAEYIHAFDAAFAKVFRAFRVLRSFRLLKHIPGMVILLEIISRSYAQLLTVLWLSSFIVFSFGILGVELFKDVSLDTEQFSSVVGFQNILQSFCTLFIVLGREGWVEIADWIEQALPNSSIYFILLTAFGSVLVLNLIVTVLVLNYKNNRHHALALQHNNLYNKVAPIVAKTAERKLLQDGFKAEVSAIHLMRIFEQKHGQTKVLTLDEYLKLRKRYGAQYRRWRKDNKIALQRYDSKDDTLSAAQSDQGNANLNDQEAEAEPEAVARGVQPPFFFEVAVALVILFFTIANVLSHFLQPLEMASTVRVISLCCGTLFSVEVVARMVWARGVVNALRAFSKSQIVDCVLVLVALPLLFAGVFQSLLVLRIPKVLSLRDRYASSSSSPEGPSLNGSGGEEDSQSIVGQVLERLKKGVLAQRFEMLKGSLLQVAPFSLILFLFMHIFAVTGLYLFGETFITSANLSTAALGYGSYLRAFVTTFQVLTGEGWNTLMYETVDAFGPWSVLYYILLLTLGNFIFLNLLLAIFIDAYINGKPESFENSKDQPKADVVTTQVRALKAQMVKQESARTQSSSERPLTSPLHRLRPTSGSKGFIRRKAYEIICWMHQHFALDFFGFAVTVVYAFGFPANEALGHACLVMMYLESIARLAIADIDKMYLADTVAVVLASSHWWFVRTAFTLSLRSVVVVRLLRWDHHVQGMVRSFGKSLPSCLVLCVTAYMVFSAFAAISVERYAGKFMLCEGVPNNKTCFDFANVTNAVQYDLAPCVAELNCYDGKSRFEWSNPKDDGGAEVMNFDAYGPAMRGIFEMATLEAWNEAMLRGTQITRVGQAPKDGSSEYDALFFILLVCVGHLLILQLFIAVMIETFLSEEMSHKGSDLLSSSQLSWVENQVQTIFQDPRKKPPGAEGSRKGLRRQCFRIVDSRRFERVICCAVLLDALLMATQYHGEPEWKTQALAASQSVFAALYLVEAIMKILAYGKAYFLSARHLFDLAIAILAVLSTVSFYTNGFIPNLTSLRVLRIAWVFPSLRAFLQLLGRAVPAMLRVLRVFLMLLYVYMFAGMALCSESVLFHSVASAARTLYIVAIGDNWTGVLKQLESECGENRDWARFMVISYVFCVTFVVMNLLIAVMLQVFEQEFLRNSLDQLSMAKYRREWFKFMSKQSSVKQQDDGKDGQQEEKRLKAPKCAESVPSLPQAGTQQQTRAKMDAQSDSPHFRNGTGQHTHGKPECVETSSVSSQQSFKRSLLSLPGIVRNGSNARDGIANGGRDKAWKSKSFRGSYMSPAVFPQLLVKLKPPLGLVDFSAGVYAKRATKAHPAGEDPPHEGQYVELQLSAVRVE